MKKVLIIAGISIIVLVVGFIFLNNYIYNQKQAPPEDPNISSYEECVEAGYPVMESYPEQCRTPSGKHFVRNLSKEELESLSAPITVYGESVCLPHWNTEGPQTLECAIGFLDGEDNYYGLNYQNISDLPAQTNTNITVTGIFTPGSLDRHQSIGTIDVESVILWEERTNQEQGFSYQYPESLGTEYVDVQEWPPNVSITTAQFLCAEPLRDIGGREYCVGEDTEGAAGSVYTTHTYNTLQEGQMITVSFTLRYSQCGNYGETQREECEQEQNTLNIDALVNQIVDSVEIL